MFITDTYLIQCIFVFVSYNEVNILKETCLDFYNAIKSLQTKHRNFGRIFPNVLYITQTLSLLKWAASHKGFNFIPRLSYSICKNGDLETLKYIISKGCKLDRISYYNIGKYGRIEILQFILSTYHSEDDLEIIQEALYDGASFNGCLEIIEYMDNCISDFNKYDLCCLEKVFENASFYGHLHIIKYLVENRRLGWNKRICELAVIGNQIGILEYLQNRFLNTKPLIVEPFSKEMYVRWYYNPNILKKVNNIEMMTWLITIGCCYIYFDPLSLYRLAIQNHNIELAIWLKTFIW